MSTKNTVKKQHTSNRVAPTAKAGKRAGGAKLMQEQVHMGKVNWIAQQVSTRDDMTIEKACQQVKANKVTEEMARKLIRAALTKVEVEREQEIADAMDRATAIAKARMANWS